MFLKKTKTDLANSSDPDSILSSTLGGKHNAVLKHGMKWKSKSKVRSVERNAADILKEKEEEHRQHLQKLKEEREKEIREQQQAEKVYRNAQEMLLKKHMAHVEEEHRRKRQITRFNNDLQFVDLSIS